MKRLTACLLALALLPACASRNNYMLNRGADLADVFRGHIMFGPGFAAQIEATRVLSLGVTYERNVFAWGLANRELATWRETISGWGVLVGNHHEESVAPLESVSGSYGWEFGESAGGSFVAPPGATALDLLTFRLTLMAVVGFDIELRLGEAFDFAAGLFQFDPVGDDLDYESMDRRPEPLRTRRGAPADGDDDRLDSLGYMR